MVENAKNKELTEKIQEIQKDLNIVKNETFKTESNKIEIEKFVILFFSFDITNSSKYKTIDYLYWPVIIHHILKRIEEEVVIKFSGEAQLWRILGDEIIFVKKVASVEEMANILEKITDDIPSKKLETFIEVFETIVKNLDKVKKDIQPESILNFEKDDLVQVSSIKGSVAIRKYLNEKGVMIKSLIKIINIDKYLITLLVDGDEKILNIEDAENIMVRKNAL